MPDGRDRSPQRMTVPCKGCRGGAAFDIPLAMAFQPIVGAASGGGVFAYEALVRGADGRGAASVLSAVDGANRYAFDQACRVAAIEAAAALGVAATGALLSINFLPNAVYEPEACIRATLRAAERTGFPAASLMFEVTEAERVRDPAHLRRILRSYKGMGFAVAIDDFGAGHSGLGLLAEFQPDLVKLDMGLVRGIDADRARRAIVGGLVRVCAELGVGVVAEGIETRAEHRALRDLGVALFQGFLFARPAFMALPAVSVRPVASMIRRRREPCASMPAGAPGASRARRPAVRPRRHPDLVYAG